MIVIDKKYLECICDEKNKYAFYEITATIDLFGYVLVRRWGRIGSKGRIMKERFPSQEETKEALNRVLKKRLSRKYILLEQSAPHSKKKPPPEGNGCGTSTFRA